MGAGSLGLRMQPSGTIRWMARLMPSFAGMSGPNMALMAKNTSALVQGQGTLMGASIWPALPVKSSVSASPATVIST